MFAQRHCKSIGGSIIPQNQNQKNGLSRTCSQQYSKMIESLSFARSSKKYPPTAKKLICPFCHHSKWPKIHLRHNKTRQNDCFDLKLGMDTFFWMRKPMVRSEFPNFKILTPFVTSLNPDCTQSGPKLTKNTIKHDEMIGLI